MPQEFAFADPPRTRMLNMYRPRIHSPAEHEKTKAWNPIGLVDMWGNVNEWLACGSLAQGSFSSDPDNPRHWRITNPVDEAINERPSLRDNLGFRVAISIPG